MHRVYTQCYTQEVRALGKCNHISCLFWLDSKLSVTQRHSRLYANKLCIVMSYQCSPGVSRKSAMSPSYNINYTRSCYCPSVVSSVSFVPWLQSAMSCEGLDGADAQCHCNLTLNQTHGWGGGPKEKSNLTPC